VSSLSCLRLDWVNTDSLLPVDYPFDPSDGDGDAAYDYLRNLPGLPEEEDESWRLPEWCKAVMDIHNARMAAKSRSEEANLAERDESSAASGSVKSEQADAVEGEDNNSIDEGIQEAGPSDKSSSSSATSSSVPKTK
jgi:hypothetical protein